jgi:hypothetical protein
MRPGRYSKAEICRNAKQKQDKGQNECQNSSFNIKRLINSMKIEDKPAAGCLHPS